MSHPIAMMPAMTTISKPPAYQPCWYCVHYGKAYANSHSVWCQHPIYPMNRTQPEFGCCSYEMVPGIAPVHWAPGGFKLPDGAISDMWGSG